MGSNVVLIGKLTGDDEKYGTNVSYTIDPEPEITWNLETRLLEVWLVKLISA